MARRCRTSICVAALLLCCVSTTARAATCGPCQLGGSPVCAFVASMIILYPNDCVAKCQGVTTFVLCPGEAVSAEAAVDDAVTDDVQQLETNSRSSSKSSASRLPPGMFLPESRRVKDGSVTWEVMNKLADQGFTFLGQFSFVDTLPKDYKLAPGAALAGIDTPASSLSSTAAEVASSSSSSSSVAKEMKDASVEEDGTQQAAEVASGLNRQRNVNRQLHVTLPEGYLYVRTYEPKVGLESSPPSPPRAAQLSRKMLQDSGIIGTDDRVFRSSVSGFPADSILYLKFQDSNNLTYICSGSLVAANIVLTAGHCVWTPHQGAHKNFRLFNGAITVNGSATPITIGEGVAVSVVSYKVLSRWAQHMDFTRDVAVLTLDQPLGTYMGWFGLAHNNCSSILTVNPVSTYGYPGDRPYGTQWGEDGCSIQSSEYSGSCDSGTGIFRHTCDIAGGQSGSPIYDSSLYVQGVVSFYEEGKLNGSPYLNNDTWNLVKGSVDDTLKPPPPARRRRRLAQPWAEV